MSSSVITSYWVYGSEEQLQELYEAIDAASTKDKYNNATVGDLLSDLGYDDQKLDEAGIEINSSVRDYCFQPLPCGKDDRPHILLRCEDSYEPAADAWNAVFKHYLGDDNMIKYYAEDVGSSVFMTNDHELDGMYRADGYLPGVLDGWQDPYGLSEAEIVELLQTTMGSDVSDMERLLEMVESSDDYSFFAGKWNVVEFKDLCKADMESCRKDNGFEL